MTATILERHTRTITSAPPSFWESLPILQQIQQHARSRLVSPWAVLGVVLTRIVATVAPEVVLPPIIGGPASLNLFVALVAKSGVGKGGAESAGREYCQWHMPIRFSEMNLGSGEGIATAFGHTVKNPDDGSSQFEQHTDSVLFSVPEIDTFLALSGRAGSTISSEMRKLWSGESLGFNNRSAERSAVVPAHHYRASMLIGVQPERSGALLDEEAGGLPQRMLWLSASDPAIPDIAPDTVPPMFEWQPPTVEANEHGKRVLTVCYEARDEIERNHRARNRGEGDALDGHSLLTRLKVAAALNLLAQAPVPGVSADDWRLAGLVMEESARVRQSCVDTLRDTARASNLARALARGEADVETDVRAADVSIAKVKARVLSIIGAAPVAKGRVQAGLSKRLREYLDAALYELEDDGKISIREEVYRGQETYQISLNPLSAGETTNA